jgi:hypothetical protein
VRQLVNKKMDKSRCTVCMWKKKGISVTFKQADFKWLIVVFINISHWTLHWYILVLLSFARLRLLLWSSNQHFMQVFIRPCKQRLSDFIRGNMVWKVTPPDYVTFYPMLHPLVYIFSSKICSMVLSMLPSSLLKMKPHTRRKQNV